MGHIIHNVSVCFMLHHTSVYMELTLRHYVVYVSAFIFSFMTKTGQNPNVTEAVYLFYSARMTFETLY